MGSGRPLPSSQGQGGFPSFVFPTKSALALDPSRVPSTSWNKQDKHTGLQEKGPGQGGGAGTSESQPSCDAESILCIKQAWCLGYLPQGYREEPAGKGGVRRRWLQDAKRRGLVPGSVFLGGEVWTQEFQGEGSGRRETPPDLHAAKALHPGESTPLSRVPHARWAWPCLPD